MSEDEPATKRQRTTEGSVQKQKSSENIVGLIGLGAMGSPMAANLLEAGFEVVVFDVNSAAVAAAVEVSVFTFF